MSTLSAAEQTRLSWARSVPSYAVVPEPYTAFFAPLLAEGGQFPYSVLTPSYEGFLHRTTEKLVCDLGHEICILKKTGPATFEAQHFPLEGISYVEVRAVLLDSSIKISGLTTQGVPASTTFKFNSVTDYLFKPILDRIRQVGAGPGASVAATEMEKFDHWITLNFKFMNYARHSLLAGEKVIQAILQPEIRGRVVKVLGASFYRVISPAHASILTDREFIKIEEDINRTRDTRYGGVWDYIPVGKIRDLSLSARGSDLLALSVQLVEGTCLESLFQVSAQEELSRIVKRFKELKTV